MANSKKPLTSLEEHLLAIQSKLNHQNWTIGELFSSLKKKGYPFLVVLLALPFCQPIQIPGFSTPFGIFLIIIGLRMAFGRRIWWPKWILKKEISSNLLKKVINKSLGFIRFLKRFTYPRLTWICLNPQWYYLHGCFIALMGFYLALPLPIPFSNFLAAWSLFFIGLGLMDEDGLFVILGYVIGILGIITLVVLIIWFRQWLYGL